VFSFIVEREFVAQVTGVGAARPGDHIDAGVRPAARPVVSQVAGAGGMDIDDS
jgi:hypothetical protein